MCQEINSQSVVFENKDFVICLKPAGMNFHSESSAGFVVQLTEQLGISLWPVHRLDKMTSGLVILAKNIESAQTFQKLFEQREIEKFYLAISSHKPKKKQGWVIGDMASARRGSWKLLPTKINPAKTQFLSASLKPKERAFLLKIHTGKTHQIRVAMKSLGAPISGDIRYESVKNAERESRAYLHAFAVKFEWKGEVVSIVQAPNVGEGGGERFLSEEFRAQLEYWQKPWELFK